MTSVGGAATSRTVVVEVKCKNGVADISSIPRTIERNTYMPEQTPIVRTISGKGEIRIPDTYQNSSSIFLFTQVLRKVRTPYVNKSWNPDEGFYANITFCIDNYVLQTYSVKYEEQVFKIYDGMSAQILSALKCAVRDILEREPQIESFEHNTFDANRILFECFGGTSLKLTLKGDKLDACVEEDLRPKKPPSPPPREPQIPYDEPTEVSNPYPGNGVDDGTNPFEGDEFEEPPLEQCIIRNIRVTVPFLNGTTFTNDGVWIGNILDNPRVLRLGTPSVDYQESLVADGYDQDANLCPTSSVQQRSLPGYTATVPQADGDNVTVEFLD